MWSVSRDVNLKCGTPSITFEWIKIRALNFVQLRYMLNEALCLLMKNSTPHGRGLGHVTHFEILGSAL